MLDLVKAYENYLSKVKKASANTIASYIRDIRQYSQWLDTYVGIDIVDAQQLNISNYLSFLEENGRSGATLSRTLASVKNFYSYAASTGFIDFFAI